MISLNNKNAKKLPLKPKATAVWLVENTGLTFEQIANFCGMHILEIKGIADGEVAIGIRGENPVDQGQINKENIEYCESHPEASLVLSEKMELYLSKALKKKNKYIPVSKRGDKPNAIAWFLKFYPTVPEKDLIKIVGTTKKTIESVKEKLNWNLENLKPRDPVLLGLCTQTELDKLLSNYQIEDNHQNEQNIE